MGERAEHDAGVHFSNATGDLRIPGICGAALGVWVEGPDQFKRESGTLFGRKTEDLDEHVGAGR